ncbi:hypothetical protein Mesop_4324 [Mesorhizobium opportunistum WSM2075]|uniref:Uncharacterized protein n=1 Tax=Mesorhizobium opportunistum (strain LMG 24607 / HAMBI 3007 / WSM2075) TaxID=536019 RepID=F7Y9M8_MESOW|nr:hypothetical protein Mesop_4324 [Mesorhizobium opportunistum WSM2075]
MLSRQVRPPSPVPLSVEQFILPSQAIHEQLEDVRSYVLSVLRSKRSSSWTAAQRLKRCGEISTGAVSA